MTETESSRQDARDAGDRLLAEHVSEDPFAAAFKATRMPMIITDPHQPDNPIIFSNRAFSELTGYSQEELVGRNCRLLQGPGSEPQVIQRIRQAIQNEESIACDVLNYRKDGSPFWNALFISPVRDSGGTVRYFFASQLDFTDVKDKQMELAKARSSAEDEVARRTRDLSEALEARTLLVHEVDHRVKNNLLTIASILKLQARITGDPTVRRTLMTVLERVEALSIVQRKLFTTDDVTRFDIADFATELVTDMVGALGREDIHLTFDVSPVLVPAIKASPFALIINELVGDAVRRGLKDGGGTIRIEVKRLNGHFLLCVADSMEPMPVNQEEQEFSRLILDACARQVKATIERSQEGSDTVVRVTAPVEVYDEGEHH
ncbi:PAS domain-containing protein [Rhizobium oryzicola]|uniref:PAS domain-containing protein n=1 Tax=Rhizobium oryzicola TaxID=1232668 RepID=A0ABT8SPU0_9HYPH|nr:PAS domain-containing protein [Rhizobium oryzicola]MDO1580491.1 PAS domain-containing protein [Rhizobium oryzicola]